MILGVITVESSHDTAEEQLENLRRTLEKAGYYTTHTNYVTPLAIEGGTFIKVQAQCHVALTVRDPDLDG